MQRNRWGVLVALLIVCGFLSACSNTNYKAVGWVDGEAGVQAFAGTPGYETPVTQPYIIKGKATVTGQYPERPHLDILLEPGATVRRQSPSGTPLQASPYGAPPAVYDGGNTSIRRR